MDGFYLCHCKYCQKDTGSAHAANLVSSTAKLSWLAGEANIKTYNLPATRHLKSFCSDCGSALPTLVMDGKMLVVPAGSLDTEVPRGPDAHIFYSRKASWNGNLETLKKFETFPG